MTRASPIPGSSSWPARAGTWTAAWRSASYPRCSCAGTGRPDSTWCAGSGWSDWSGRNAEFFARSGEPLDEAVAIVVTGALMLAVAEISLGTDEERARQLADSVIQVLSRIEIRSL